MSIMIEDAGLDLTYPLASAVTELPDTAIESFAPLLMVNVSRDLAEVFEWEEVAFDRVNVKSST